MLGSMKRYAAIAALALLAFGAGIAAAKAQYGWTRIPAPCAPAGVSITGSEIALICPDDRTVYIKTC